MICHRGRDRGANPCIQVIFITKNTISKFPCANSNKQAFQQGYHFLNANFMLG